MAGTDSPADSYYGERAQLVADYAGPSGIESAYILDDSTWDYFPSYDVPATQGRGLSNCWNPGCSGMHNGTMRYALCSTCRAFEPGSRRCKR